MRTASTIFAALALAAAPLSAQVSARVLIDIPILGGHRGQGTVDRYPASRYIDVRDYSSRRHGNWRKDYRKWHVVTLFLLDGRYYERSYRGARPVSVYYYRNEYFFEPRDRDYYRMRDDRWDDRRNDRYDNRRDDRYDNRRNDRSNGRDDRRFDSRDNSGRDDRYDGRARQRN